jgi:hypothetical protein
MQPSLAYCCWYWGPALEPRPLQASWLSGWLGFSGWASQQGNQDEGLYPWENLGLQNRGWLLGHPSPLWFVLEALAIPGSRVLSYLFAQTSSLQCPQSSQS